MVRRRPAEPGGQSIGGSLCLAIRLGFVEGGPAGSTGVAWVGPAQLMPPRGHTRSGPGMDEAAWATSARSGRRLRLSGRALARPWAGAGLSPRPLQGPSRGCGVGWRMQTSAVPCVSYGQCWTFVFQSVSVAHLGRAVCKLQTHADVTRSQSLQSFPPWSAGFCIQSPDRRHCKTTEILGARVDRRCAALGTT